MRKSIFSAAFICLLMGAVTPVTASTIYTYTGANFNLTHDDGTHPASYTIDMFLSVTLEFANPLSPNLLEDQVAPIAFTFSDGVNTINETDALRAHFTFATDGTGAITGWNVGALKPETPTGPSEYMYNISSSMDGPDYPVSTLSDRGSIDLCVDLDLNPTCPVTHTVDSGSRGYSDGLNIPEWTVSTVPVPATAWLFGSGLLGLIGFARRSA